MGFLHPFLVYKSARGVIPSQAKGTLAPEAKGQTHARTHTRKETELGEREASTAEETREQRPHFVIPPRLLPPCLVTPTLSFCASVQMFSIAAYCTGTRAYCAQYLRP